MIKNMDAPGSKEIAKRLYKALPPEFKDEEGNVNPDGYEVYKNAGDLVEWVESWGTDPDEINSPGPWRNCCRGGGVSSPPTRVSRQTTFVLVVVMLLAPSPRLLRL